MISKSGNKKLVEFWNEIVDVIDYSYNDNECLINSQIAKIKAQAEMNYFQKGFNEGYQMANTNNIDVLRMWRLMELMIEKKPDNWKNYVNYISGAIKEDKLWQ